jgi:hypothetical protein
MSNEQLIEGIHLSLQRLYENDSYLIIKDLSEPCISHQLARHLQECFNHYNVDCEYNGAADQPLERKKVSILKEKLDAHGLLKEKELDDDELLTERNVFPDIIIHKRGTNDLNKCIIEVKKENNTTPFEYDIIKLESYTSQEFGNNLCYQLGVFIILKTKIEELKYNLIFFRKGKEIKV